MKPEINVTPLIDVLLVLLVIFMLISPLKPGTFEMRIPGENKKSGETPRLLLVVRINRDSTVSLNGMNKLGTVENPAPLAEKLKEVFDERTKNNVISEAMQNQPDALAKDLIEKTVFVSAPGRTSYGNVVRIIDAIKEAGANPISLQMDDLD